MAYLTPSSRRALERTIRQARAAAQEGAADAFRRLGVAEPRRPAHLTEAQAQFRNRLRAHARALGDALTDGTQAIDRLIEQAAYVQWHRLLFARFLLERRLLRHPEDGGDLTLLDCREEASALGLANEWAAAAHYTARLLPGVFPPDDPVEAISLAPEHARALRQHLRSLDAEMFAAEDTLGWTYQFWRSQEKAEINASGRKIGAVELPAVTQLFTEPYMVRFLLHNTLGAWWAGKVLERRPELAEATADEASLRRACSPPGYALDMLRFVREDVHWRPAAGVFRGWPRDAKAITVLDPCCGSGHFLTEALAILVALRQAEENLSAAEAAAAVLRDNLFGLEIDGRCVQIAAFAVALAAWRLGGWHSLPLPHIAWSGAPPPLPKADFVALANGGSGLALALSAIHDLFRQAPLLGSLIEPIGGDLADPVRVARIEDMLEPLIERARSAEPERAEGTIAARGMAEAAAILSQRYTLQATNVPYLGRGKQVDELASYLGRNFNDAKSDLATAMVARMIRLAKASGAIAVVTPQNWYALDGYKAFRRTVLTNYALLVACDLGPAAFQDMNWWAARTALTVIYNDRPEESTRGSVFSAKDHRDTDTKPHILLKDDLVVIKQNEQLLNPDQRIATERIVRGVLLSDYASSRQGIKTGDDGRFRRSFWELQTIGTDWRFFRTSPDQSTYFSGCHDVLSWRNEGKDLARLQGLQSLDHFGCAVGQMNQLPVSIYLGEAFDSNVSAIVPKDASHLAAIWTYISSQNYRSNVRQLEPGAKVNNATFTKVAFDLSYWEKAAAEAYPNGLPEPYTEDPTEWLFHGHPARAHKGTALHVALARVCGYRWPAERDKNIHLSAKAREWIAKAADLPAGDSYGLLAVPAVAGERPLIDRLRGYLAEALSPDWTDALERCLVAEANEVFDKRPARDGSLEAWLRDRAFRQHSALFHQRPFLWHVWDGQADGFAAFLHYHGLTRTNLEKLTFSVLGAWIARMRDAGDNRRLEAAQILQEKLQAILSGESPLDIFVRWKPRAAQPIGWNPDLDDGVRINIRPFVCAGVLRDTPNIHWRKDRGEDSPDAPWYAQFKGKRINDHRLTLAEKQGAREAVASRVA